MSNQEQNTAKGSISRRRLLGSAAAAGASLFVGGPAATAQRTLQRPAPSTADKPVTGERILQSVCQWCFSGMSLEQLSEASARIGLRGIDLVGPETFPTLKKYGLVGTMTPTHGITKGLNRKENHEECLGAIRRAIEATADAGFPNVICFAGNREGLSDAEGLKNCAEGLKQVVGLAEQRKVTICMELLNSRVNHPDYMGDSTTWGVKLVQSVGSPRFKLLYDIYHMQVQEGNVIATINAAKDYIGHYHTAGVPGRNEIDDSQELNYPAIMRAIVDTGFKGYVAHEFTPRRNPLTSLSQAAHICDV